MTKLSKQDVTNKRVLKTRWIRVESLDGELLFKNLNAAQAVKLNEYATDGKVTHEYIKNLILMSVIDGEGKQFFTPEEIDDLDAVTFGELHAICTKLNDPTEVMKKALETLKNL